MGFEGVRILIISDTHGNQTTINGMVQYLQHHSIDLTIHLGDDYQDAQVIINAGFPVIRIPGTWTAEYKNIFIENRRIEEIEGWRFFLTHTPEANYNDLANDKDPQKVFQSGACDVFCHGHTHRPEITLNNKIIRLNPGHLKKAEDRGYLASFAVVDVTSSAIKMTLIEYESGDVIESQSFHKSPGGLRGESPLKSL